MSDSFLELVGINRWYGQQHALRDVTLTLPYGRIGLLGPNGAGKSTLLKILLGLMPPSSGVGTVLGEPLLAPKESLSFFDTIWQAIRGATSEVFGQGSLLRRGIGYMPERDGLVPGMRGAEYVALAGELDGMARKQAQRRAHELLTCLGLEDARYRMIDEYSLGMKQRLRLAQALVHDPPVLLLDEPTSGLDPAGRDTMLDLLLTLNENHGKTILLCTHLLGDVERVCDTVVIVNRGMVLRHA
ncbi:MAG: ABC transporter ATP-binding protein [Gemmataceae bacterium]